MRQLEGFIEHSSERATQEETGKPYLIGNQKHSLGSAIHLLLKTILWRAVSESSSVNNF